MVSRLAGAALRAFLVIILIVTPSVLLPGTGSDGKQMVALVALFAGALTFTEYKTPYPGLVEFRDAPPFNRVRFLILFFTVFLLTVIEKAGVAPTTLSTLIHALGIVIGQALDFPYSPVRLAKLMLADGAPEAQQMAVATAAGMAYLISLVGMMAFVLVLKLQGWPQRVGGFNVWVNLPTFDPTASGDIVVRLERDARLNIALGFLLPFLIPAVVKIGASGFSPLTLSSPQTLIWTLTAWSFLPCSLFMRGIAMGKIAAMIREKRRIEGVEEGSEYLPA
ncbi:MAG: hypothetical protein JNN06_02060 [Gemmobacter sp.]|uniref:hypothetical protein n=1 Tax=Gemmobacter sp. TaxID=1898957 RepID=UPI001A6274CE|nr:hypothetical protein [Gemmobacter sp.]MBL8561041.1 hypothetical protein [Gemmobacter sp.]